MNRSGVDDLVLAFSITSTVLLVAEMLDKQKNVARAKSIDVQLDRIEAKLDKLIVKT